MLEVQTKSTTYTSNESNNTQTQQNTNNTLFQSLLQNQTTPEDITFEEYKNLTEEELDKLFGDKEDILRHAKGLHHTATWTNDDTFNSIIFNIYIDDIKNETDNGKMYFHAQLLTVTKLEENTLNIGNLEKNLPPGTNIKDAKEMLEFLANIENNIQNKSDRNWLSSADPDRVVEVAKNIVAQYNAKTSENSSILNSYTRTNTTSPINTQSYNKTEKLFEEILEDNSISYDEIENLSFDETVQFTNYFMNKNEKGDFLPNPRVTIDRKAGMLLSATVITQNESYNQAVFHSIRKIKDEDFLETFMFDITGTQFSDKIITYPDLRNENYEKGVNAFITKKLASYQTKLDTAVSEEDKENYQSLIEIFTRLDHMNKSFNNQSIHEKEDNLIERMRELVDNIISIIKTGFTLEELEYIEELLAEIKKRIRESRENGTNSDEDIKKMMKQLERAVAELQKRVTGVAVIETGEDSLQNSDQVSISTDSLSFEARIDKIETSIEKMKTGQLLEIEIDTDKTEEEKEEDKKW